MAKPLPFKSFLLHLAQEVIRADAEMQLLQRRAWIELHQGFPLMEGIDHLSHLGLTEVKMTFWLEEIPPGFWARLRQRLLLFGRPVSLSKRFYRFGPERRAEGGFAVTVTVGRDKTGRVVARSEPSADALKEIYVTDTVA